jgi:signal transduction histidine kinase
VRINTTESADARTAVVEVVDGGIGIPQADLGRVFEHFFRGSNVVGQILGTGIGLGGVRDIVERHGGAIDIVSRPGTGTAVSVRLPLGYREVRPAGAG